VKSLLIGISLRFLGPNFDWMTVLHLVKKRTRAGNRIVEVIDIGHRSRSLSAPFYSRRRASSKLGSRCSAPLPSARRGRLSCLRANKPVVRLPLSKLSAGGRNSHNIRQRYARPSIAIFSDDSFCRPLCKPVAARSIVGGAFARERGGEDRPLVVFQHLE